MGKHWEGTVLQVEYKHSDRTNIKHRVVFTNHMSTVFQDGNFEEKGLVNFYFLPSVKHSESIVMAPNITVLHVHIEIYLSTPKHPINVDFSERKFQSVQCVQNV